MQRDNQLKSIRPEIPMLIEESAITPQERFQNKILRPILKLQNELLVAIFKQYIEKRKGVFNRLPRLDKQAYIETAIQKDVQFRNLLVGCIVGHFTIEEYGQFREDESALTRRMMQMCIERLQDQLVERRRRTE